MRYRSFRFSGAEKALNIARFDDDRRDDSRRLTERYSPFGRRMC
jgi:hypothetical protein